MFISKKKWRGKNRRFRDLVGSLKCHVFYNCITLKISTKDSAVNYTQTTFTGVALRLSEIRDFSLHRHWSNLPPPLSPLAFSGYLPTFVDPLASPPFSSGFCFTLQSRIFHKDGDGSWWG
ncbi:unnamed protein product [Lactuca virosa]|uniref:Uncharacterized protein n=1 Tax=Lactuca virosa TaxID=75947 RepID=A0AAU9NKG0_9ASTR|nr:unnamed protein product [Lactuca virosa]